jgi:O-antigen ligase
MAEAKWSMSRPTVLTVSQCGRIADALAVATAASLPWSTSVTSILLVLWVLLLLPTLSWSDIRQVLATPAGGLPVLLCLLALIGMAWADVGLHERWRAFVAFLKLPLIPLLLVQFRRSEQGLAVFAGYVAACVVLLVATVIAHAVPPLSFLVADQDGVLTKNAATQSGEFVICIFGLLFVAVDRLERRRWAQLIGILAAVLAMLASIAFMDTGRTALVIFPVLLVLFAARTLSRRGTAILFLVALVAGAAVWMTSPYLRGRTIEAWTDYQKYEKSDAVNSSGERLEFYKKSLEFIRQAPIIGHGTGSIKELFKRSAIGKTGAAGRVTDNPHNQTFAVAIQLGLIGAAVLWAMWIAHLLLFRGGGLAAWVGCVIVVQNIVGSLFNSHLFDFVQGWVYMLGVGIAGGMVLKARAAKTSAGTAP